MSDTENDTDGALEEGQGQPIDCIEESYEENDILDVPEMDDDDEDDV
jgi:hypothetical protein